MGIAEKHRCSAPECNSWLSHTTVRCTDDQILLFNDFVSLPYRFVTQYHNHPGV
jgi:hypothetical protein